MKPSFRVSIFLKIKNKNLWLSLCSPAPHTPWLAPSEARVFPLGRCGGWGWRGGSLDSASPAGVEPGFCPLGGEGRSHHGSTWLVLPAIHSVISSRTRWSCTDGRRAGGPFISCLSRWPGLLSRDLWRLGGWGAREGSLLTSLSIPHPQLCVLVCASA